MATNPFYQPPKPNSGTKDLYCSERQLPPYRFVPGLNPHPINDPNGHAYGVEFPKNYTSELTERNSHQHPGFLYGVDLFNHAYWWECHELFEAIWKASPNQKIKNALQGIIQIAAILLNACMGPPKDAAIRNLYTSVSEKFSELADGNLGIHYGNLQLHTKNALPLILSETPSKQESAQKLDHLNQRILWNEIPIIHLDQAAKK